MFPSLKKTGLVIDDFLDVIEDFVKEAKSMDTQSDPQVRSKSLQSAHMDMISKMKKSCKFDVSQLNDLNQLEQEVLALSENDFRDFLDALMDRIIGIYFIWYDSVDLAKLKEAKTDILDNLPTLLGLIKQIKPDLSNIQSIMGSFQTAIQQIPQVQSLLVHLNQQMQQTIVPMITIFFQSITIISAPVQI